MCSNSLFDKILNEGRLGTLTSRPQRITGGYMHKMYKLETTSGTYALKLLNPSIMKRPDAFLNYQRAEELEAVLQENNIPIVPALKINGCKMQCVENQFYYIFQWVEGKTLSWDEIKEEHCKIAGGLLAKIHKIKETEMPFTSEKINVDWDTYIRLVNTRCPEIAEELKNCRDLLYSGQYEYNETLENIPGLTCLCNGDMDSKNVLWVDENPWIIELESLDYGNPFLEMFQLALSWSGGTVCRMDYTLLDTFLTSYRQEYGSLFVDWSVLYGAGFSWLLWLLYNIKRALMIECENEEERKVGINEVHETIQRIVYYDSIKEELLRHLPIGKMITSQLSGGLNLPYWRKK